VNYRLGHITRMAHMDTVIGRKGDNCTEVTSDSALVSEITLLSLDCACSLYPATNRRDSQASLTPVAGFTAPHVAL
jgi:hypothetical protein